MKAFLARIFLFAALTILTQIGGVMYLVYLPLGLWIKRQELPRWQSIGSRAFTFGCLYLIVTIFLVPPLARSFGRTPLPWRSSLESPLQPRNWLFCLANRHYVHPELAAALTEVGRVMALRNPELRIQYLDANFPFLDGFRLLPHLSHHDGRKVDLAFFYRNKQSKRITQATPSAFGYGGCETPRSGEPDQPAECRRRGYWQYSLVCRLMPALARSRLILDDELNRELINRLASHPKMGKLFIEPHLRQRWRLATVPKIRYHGCQAVRHDDHIHVQL